MKINKAGIDLIKRFEGFRASPYQCSAGMWTIGYGSTRDPYDCRISKDHAAISIQEAERWLSKSLLGFERGLRPLVTIELNANQWSALISLAYNIGVGALRKSNTLKCLNAGDFEQMATEWREWRKAGGKVQAGLIHRREAELELFFKEENDDTSDD